MSQVTKICPYCGEEIKSIAIKCRYCGSMLSDAPPSSGSIGGITLVRQALASRYEIIEEIGRGGMATVYRAVQKNLQRPVALKVIHQNLVHDSEFVARFHREAQVCASLQNPNIVTVYDEGEVSGVHFMAMELLDGRDLHHIIRQQGQLTVEQTLAWIAPIAQALQYAHSRGIIHRDIKSSNILVSNNGRPVLMDFGIAHAASGTRLTQTGLVIGTPEYMSPEQAEGKPIDHRTDIYSLGIVLYECLTGQVPFKADNPLSIIMKVVNEAPAPPINLNNKVPPWLSNAILKSISKNPGDRFAEAGIFAEALTGNSTQKYDPSTIGMEQEFHSKKPEAQTKAPAQSEVTWKLGDSIIASEPPKSVTQAKKAKQSSNTGLKVAAWLLFIALLFSAALWFNQYVEEQDARKSEEIFYNNALTRNTIADYDRYLRTYPNGRFFYEAKRRKEEFIEEQSRNDPFHDQMVFVKGGTFTMGCTSEQGSDCYDNEKPSHRVTVSDFYIGKYEVTQKQWRTVMGSDPPELPFKGCDDCPVDRLSWNDVQDFIKKLNQTTGKKYRLPTEAEWEYAARGGNQSRGYKYAGSNNIDEVAWYEVNSDLRINPVGRKKPNELGLYDMSGNVWEWCSDYFGSFSNDPKTDPHGPPSGWFIVHRGGSLHCSSRLCRVTNRSSFTPNTSHHLKFGVRLSLSVD
jgi:serine/threonine protein kinase